MASLLPSVKPTSAVQIAALIMGLVVQTAGIVWWGARIDERVTQVERKAEDVAAVQVTIARLDERTANLVTTVNRIDARQGAQEEARMAKRP